MKAEEIKIEYELFDSVEELSESDAHLVNAAREITAKAYAPYSNFLVGAVALLSNGATVAGTNQENASYPVGICAERVLLSSASMLHTEVPIETMAVSYHNLKGESSTPVSPCGMCRQALNEYEFRTSHSIRMILSGMEGKIIIIKSASLLLPLSFGTSNMK